MCMVHVQASIDQKLAHIESVLSAAEAAGFIYNQAYKDLRTYDVSRTMEKDWNSTTLLYYHSPDRDRDARLEDSYVIFTKLSPEPHTIKSHRREHTKSASAHRRLEEVYRHRGAVAYADYTARTAALEAMGEVITRWEPICERLNALKDKVKKGMKPSETPRTTPARTLDHTGTCACGKNVKLTGGKLYDHGFTILPGWRAGNCIGVGHEPIEVSTDCLQAFLTAYQDKVARNEEALASDPKQLRDTWSQRKRYTPAELVSEGDPKWERVRRYWENELRGQISILTPQIERLKVRITEWTPQPLPDQI